jgi:hypothetical protein
MAGRAAIDGIGRVRQPAGTVSIFVVHSNGRVREAVMPVTYEDVYTFLNAHADRCERERHPSRANGCLSLREAFRQNDQLSNEVAAEANAAR